MAMIDYGAVVFKDGKQINHKFFEDMRESVGWSDEGRVYISRRDGEKYPNNYLNGNFFAYCGDASFTIAFYKTYCRFSDINNEFDIYASNYDFSSSVYHKSLTTEYNGVKVRIKEITNRVYMASFQYKGSNYNVVYGYGIDPDMNIWNNIKVRFLGKNGARKVDNIYKRYINVA